MTARESRHTWSTSRNLINQARENSPDAWQRMSHVYTPLVYGWVRKAGLQQNDAADVVQDVFLIVAGALERFRHDRPEDTFRGWLLTITRNELRGWFRRQAKIVVTGEGGADARQFIEQVPQWVDENSSVDLEEDSASETELVRRAAELVRQDFQPHTWQAFWQTAVDGRSTSEVAESLEMSTVAVRQARFRVLARLREVLE